jgi:hypothetical protein
MAARRVSRLAGHGRDRRGEILGLNRLRDIRRKSFSEASGAILCARVPRQRQQGENPPCSASRCRIARMSEYHQEDQYHPGIGMVPFKYLKRLTYGRYGSNGGARLVRIDDVKCPVGVVINPDCTDSLIAIPDEHNDPVHAEPRKWPASSDGVPDGVSSASALGQTRTFFLFSQLRHRRRTRYACLVRRKRAKSPAILETLSSSATWR